MGTWIGRGKWVYSWEEKKAYAAKKKQEYLYSLNKKKEETKKVFFNQTQLKSFLSNKDIEEFFSNPDDHVRTKFGFMKLFKINKVLSTIKKNGIKIKIKKSFEDIENEEAKQKILCLQKQIDYIELSTELPLKKVLPRKINKI